MSEERKIKTIAEYLEATSAIKNQWPNSALAFRGQENEGWSLGRGCWVTPLANPIYRVLLFAFATISPQALTRCFGWAHDAGGPR